MPKGEEPFEQLSFDTCPKTEIDARWESLTDGELAAVTLSGLTYLAAVYFGRHDNAEELLANHRTLIKKLKLS